MTDKTETPHPVPEGAGYLPPERRCTISRKKHTKKRVKPQGKRKPHNTKTLKNVKVKVEFWAAIVTITAGVIAILVSILK
jgi:hypothetical protein